MLGTVKTQSPDPKLQFAKQDSVSQQNNYNNIHQVGFDFQRFLVFCVCFFDDVIYNS